MSDPFNLLPTDPAWVKRVDTLTEQAAVDLKCMVVMVAVQEDGKLMICSHGGPKTGMLAELADDPPRLLMTLAAVTAAMDQHGEGETRQ